MFISIAFISLINLVLTNSTCFELLHFTNTNFTRIIYFNHRNKNLKYIKNDFYKACFIITTFRNFSFSKKNCLYSQMEKNPKYNCISQKNLFNLKNEARLYDPIFIKDSYILTFDLKLNLLQKSRCINPEKTLEEKYGIKLLSKNPMRISIINAIFSTYKGFSKQFYEEGENVMSFNPIGKKIPLNLIIKQLNVSESLKVKSFTKNRSLSDLKRSDKSIFLESNNDLKIEKAALYLNKVFSDIYHEVLYLCVRNTEKKISYHFIVDRSARDPTYERATWTKTFKKIFKGNSISTLIRVVYYSQSKDSNKNKTPDNKKFNENYNLINVGKNQKGNLRQIRNFLSSPIKDRDSKFKPSILLNSNVTLNKNSFKKFIIAIQLYALKYRNYNIFDNCQHFATGFFNYLTNQNEDYVNLEIMKKLGAEEIKKSRSWKESFEKFFKNQTNDTM